MTQKRILGICPHFYPEMVSTGLHMTELFTGIAGYPENDFKVYCTYPIKEEYQALNVPTTEVYKNVSIQRAKNVGAEHKSLLSKLISNLTFTTKTFLYAMRKRKEYDLILITTDPPFLAIICWLMKKIFKKPYVLIMYDVYPDIAIKLDVLKEKGFVSRFWNWFNKRTFANASKLVVIGEDMKSLLQTNFPNIPGENYELIHNWSDKNFVHPIEREENQFIKDQSLEGKRILLYSGNMGRTHNVESILEAAIELDGKFDDVVFLFIGGGIKKSLVKEHIEEKRSSNVMQLPFQPFEILGHVLSSASFSFVCLDDDFTGMSVPSKSYGIMASKTPILGLLRSDSEIAETIKRDNSGWVWNSESNQPLSTLIEEILSDGSQIKTKGENAFKSFEQNYDLAISVDKYNELLKSV